jgi:site-specific DNA-methyltransferase (adenine-specific)
MKGDCLERMKDIPDGSVDMILCDLPYGTTACAWDSVIPFEPLWEKYKRVIKPNAAIVLTASQPFTTALIASNIKEFRYCWVWDKVRATNFMSAKWMPLLKTEDVCVFSTASCNAMSKTRMTYHPQGVVQLNRVVKNGKNVGGRVASDRGAVFAAGKEYKQEFTSYPKNLLSFGSEPEAVHPTQKPVALMEYLIKTYTNEGETVLDNTMGSGTTGVACVNTSRKFIGIEMDDAYFDIAKNRILDSVTPKLLENFFE